jgi:hypothetical protein
MEILIILVIQIKIWQIKWNRWILMSMKKSTARIAAQAIQIYLDFASLFPTSALFVAMIRKRTTLCHVDTYIALSVSSNSVGKYKGCVGRADHLIRKGLRGM